MSINKQELHLKCLDILNLRIEKYSKEIKEKRDSNGSQDMQNNYEEPIGTGEVLGDIDSISEQLDLAKEMKSVLSSIDPKKRNQYIGKGSVIETDKTFYFISVPLGKINLDDGRSVYAISEEAPLYQELKEKSPGDSIFFRGETIEIIEIW